MFKKLMFARQIQMERGEIVLMGQRMVMLPAVTFHFLQNKKDCKKYLYYAGKLADSIVYTEGIMKKYGLVGRKVVDWMKNSAEVGGWGQIEVKEYDSKKKRCIIHFKNPPVSFYNKKMDHNHMDDLSRGYVAGALCMAFNDNIDTVEVKCQNLGSPFCEYVSKPTKEFDSSSPIVQEQLDLSGRIEAELSESPPAHKPITKTKNDSHDV